MNIEKGLAYIKVHHSNLPEIVYPKDIIIYADQNSSYLKGRISYRSIDDKL